MPKQIPPLCGAPARNFQTTTVSLAPIPPASALYHSTPFATPDSADTFRIQEIPNQRWSAQE